MRPMRYSGFPSTVSVNNERQRGQLVAIFEGVGVLGFQLGYMEDVMDANRARKAKGEGHG